MASSRTPLLADPRRNSLDSTDEDEEIPFLYGFATTSPTRPFSTTFNPTLLLRSLALILSLPAFIIFIVHGPHYAAAITFLSFALARQVVVLGSHFGSQVVVVRIEVVHPRLKGVSARAQETWIKRGIAAVIDGGILLGMLVSLSLVAHEVDQCRGSCYLPASVTAAVILGFIAFGLLLLSVPDFGNPESLAMAVAVEKPIDGVLRLATSVVFGEPEETEDEHQHTHKNKPRMPAEDVV
ncbi:hypothetical protein EG329_003363 [Mollisiaceae sp. DMI_Dod_QoI]|nr:hypothetical protein EG329_003363 [Helotiales sp. DMI_Dod_QoI]